MTGVSKSKLCCAEIRSIILQRKMIPFSLWTQATVSHGHPFGIDYWALPLKLIGPMPQMGRFPCYFSQTRFLPTSYFVTNAESGPEWIPRNIALGSSYMQLPWVPGTQSSSFVTQLLRSFWISWKKETATMTRVSHPLHGGDGSKPLPSARLFPWGRCGGKGLLPRSSK
jgi:hypothetical protein